MNIERTPTEAAMQAMLDQDPRDYLTRRVLSDYLYSIDDPRAEGYNILGWAKCWPLQTRDDPIWRWRKIHTSDSFGCQLKSFWFAHLHLTWKPAPKGCHESWGGWHAEYPTRIEAEDDAALAWLQVNPTWRERCLKSAMEK